MSFDRLHHAVWVCAAIAAPLLVIKLWVLLDIGYYSPPQFVGDAMAVTAICGLLVLCARWRPLRGGSWLVASLVYGLALLVGMAEAISYYFQASSFNNRFFANVRLGNLRSGVDAFPYLFAAALLLLTAVLACAGWLLARQSRLRARDESIHRIFKGIVLVGLAVVAVSAPSAWQRLVRAAAHGSGDELAAGAAGRAVAEQLNTAGTARIGLRASAGKNLVIIYMESLERVYTDDRIFPGLTPNLNRWRAQGLDFSGYLTFPGATYTMAGIFASQCGVPFFTTPSQALDFTGDDANATSFQPNMACLGDALRVAGYSQVFMNGSPLSFADQGTFFRMHGFDRVLGLDQLEAAHDNKLPKPGWGLYDSDLFRLAKSKFNELAASGKPFNLDVLTIDNHPPHGRPSPGCPKYTSNDNDVLQAVHCTDFLVGKFLDAISGNPAWKNTIVAVMSDHQSLRNDAWPLYPKWYERRPLLFILNAGQGVRGMRFYHMDIAPTLLHLMGVDTNATFIAGADRSEPDAPGNPLVDNPIDIAVLRKTVWERAQPVELCRRGVLVGDAADGFTVGGREVPISQNGARMVGLSDGQQMALLIGKSDVVGVVDDSARMTTHLQKRGANAALLIRPLANADPMHQFSLTWIGVNGARALLGDVPRLQGLRISAPRCKALVQKIDAAPAGETLDLRGRFEMHTAPLYPPLLRETDFATDEGRPLQRGLGWLAPEHWGSWTDGHMASLGFTLPEGACHAARLDFRVIPYLTSSRRVLDVRVFANGEPMTAWHFDKDSNWQPVEVQTPVATPDMACRVDLRFEFFRPGSHSPPYPATEDPRSLQLGIEQMRLMRAGR